MSGIFNLDAPIWSFMNEVADIIILGILWWCCCLGIVTIGASTTALYYVLGKKMRKETTYVAKDFFKSFRMNFRQSVPLSILALVAYLSLGLYISFIIAGVYTGEGVGSLKFLVPLTIIVGFEVINISSYTWSLLSRFEMPTRNLLKSAFAMTHKHLVATIWNMIVIAVVAFFVVKMPLAIVVAPSLIVFGQSYVLQPLFFTYIEANKVQEQEEFNEEDDQVIETIDTYDEEAVLNENKIEGL